MRNPNIALLALLLATVPAAALAQTKTAPAPPKPAAKTVEGLVVTGQAAEVQTSIDRRSYSVGKDLQAATGSVGDALRNVPAVDVDPQGNLTLRGDGNVTIQIDGKPAGIFNGPGRADALQQLPADRIERVEVITTPSAAENPEGSGGIINLVTKKSQGAGKTGSLYATAGSAGLKRAGATFGYNSKKLNVTGSLSGNYQRNKSDTAEVRSTLNGATGQFVTSRINFAGRNLTRGPSAHLGLDYAVDPKTQLTASIDVNQLLVHGYPFGRFETDGVDGLPVAVIRRQGARIFTLEDMNSSVGWRRTFAGEGHQLSIDLTHNESRPTDHTIFTIGQALPPTATSYESAQGDGIQQRTDLKAAYARPLPHGAKLKTGYELRYEDNQRDDRLARGATIAGLKPDPGFTNELLFKQTVNAVYGTYERPFGDLTLLGGLRVESVRRDLDLVTTRVTSHTDYTRAYPSLHFDYKLEDGQKLAGGYSVRVQRPPEQLLNPFVVFGDPKNLRQGNPQLKPAETQSFELAYERRKGQTYYLATAFYRRNQNEFTQIFRDVGGGVVLTTFANIGNSRSSGLELVASGRLAKTLTYNASTTFSWNQIDTGDPSFGGPRSAYGIAGRANLNWQAAANDLVQLNLFAQGPRLAPQGSVDPIQSLNLGWRHKFNDRVTATMTAQDIFDSNRFHARLDTLTLRDSFEGGQMSRSISIRLDYRLGGASARPQREPGFDYESGGGGGGSPL